MSCNDDCNHKNIDYRKPGIPEDLYWEIYSWLVETRDKYSGMKKKHLPMARILEIMKTALNDAMKF